MTCLGLGARRVADSLRTLMILMLPVKQLSVERFCCAMIVFATVTLAEKEKALIT